MAHDGTGEAGEDAGYTRADVLGSLSRRQLLTVAAGGTAAVAGCGGGGGPSEDGTTTTGGGGGGTTTTPPPDTSGTDTTSTDGSDSQEQQASDIYFIEGQRTAIEQAQMNEWNAKTGFRPPWYGNRAVMQGNDYGIYLGGWAASYEHLNEATTLKLGPLNGPFEYPDGQAFDHQLPLDNNKYLYETFLQVAGGTFDRSIFNYKNLRMADDAYKLDYKQGGNPTLNRLRAMPKESGNGLTDRLRTHPELHKEFLDKGREATSASEKQTVIQGLLTHEIPLEEGIQTMGTDPGEIQSLTRSQIVVNHREPYSSESYPWGFQNWLNPDTPWYREEWAEQADMAGYISLPFIEDMMVAARNTLINAAVAGKIDTIDDIVKPSAVEQFPEGWRLVPGTTQATYVVGFSPGSDVGKNDEAARAIRQGIAYLLDPGQFSAVAHFPPPVHKVSGMPYSAMERRWLGSVSQYNDTFTNYGSSGTGWVQQEKGYEKLREGGLEQRDGVWHWADSGERFTLRFVYRTGSEPNISSHATAIEEQLQEHGVTIDVNNVEGSRMGTLVKTEDGRAQWDIALMPGNMRTVPHPWFGFSSSFGLGSFDLSEDDPLGVSAFRNGYGEVDVPMPVGDPEGELQTVDYDRMVNRLPQAGDEETEEKLVRRICWTINQWVPAVAVLLEPDPNAINAYKFAPKVPLDHPAWTFQTEAMTLLGLLDANPEYTPMVAPQEGTKIGLDG